jgi:hypothetical protein
MTISDTNTDPLEMLTHIENLTPDELSHFLAVCALSGKTSGETTKILKLMLVFIFGKMSLDQTNSNPAEFKGMYKKVVEDMRTGVMSISEKYKEFDTMIAIFSQQFDGGDRNEH